MVGGYLKSIFKHKGLSASAEQLQRSRKIGTKDTKYMSLICNSLWSLCSPWCPFVVKYIMTFKTAPDKQ